MKYLGAILVVLLAISCADRRNAVDGQVQDQTQDQGKREVTGTYQPAESFQEERKQSLKIVEEYGFNATASDLITKDLLEGKLTDKEYFRQKIALVLGVGDLNSKYLQGATTRNPDAEWCGTPLFQEIRRYLARPSGDPETRQFLEGIVKAPSIEPAALAVTAPSRPQALEGDPCLNLASEVRLDLGQEYHGLESILKADRCRLVPTAYQDFQILYREGDQVVGLVNMIDSFLRSRNLWQELQGFFGEPTLVPKSATSLTPGGDPRRYNIWIVKGQEWERPAFTGVTLSYTDGTSLVLVNAKRLEGCYPVPADGPVPESCLEIKYPRASLGISGKDNLESNLIHEFTHAFENAFSNDVFERDSYLEGLANFAPAALIPNSRRPLTREYPLLSHPHVPVSLWRLERGYASGQWFRYLHAKRSDNIAAYLTSLKLGTPDIEALFDRHKMEFHEFAFANLNLDHGIPNVVKYRALSPDYPREALVVGSAVQHFDSHAFNGRGDFFEGSLKPWGIRYIQLSAPSGRNHYQAVMIKNESSPDIKLSAVFIGLGTDRTTYRVLSHTPPLAVGDNLFTFSGVMEEQPAVILLVASLAPPLADPAAAEVPLKVGVLMRLFAGPVSFSCHSTELRAPGSDEPVTVLVPWKLGVDMSGVLDLPWSDLDPRNHPPNEITEGTYQTSGIRYQYFMGGFGGYYRVVSGIGSAQLKGKWSSGRGTTEWSGAETVVLPRRINPEIPSSYLRLDFKDKRFFFDAGFDVSAGRFRQTNFNPDATVENYEETVQPACTGYLVPAGPPLPSSYVDNSSQWTDSVSSTLSSGTFSGSWALQFDRPVRTATDLPYRGFQPNGIWVSANCPVPDSLFLRAFLIDPPICTGGGEINAAAPATSPCTFPAACIAPAIP